MVGPPKRLEDLREVNGAIRVTCRACMAVRMLDLEELIRARSTARQSTDWRAVREGTPCPNCGSADVRIDGVPFGENMGELRARRSATVRLDLALRVLNEGAGRQSAMPLIAVRLALRVLHPFVGDRDLLVTYWQQITGDQKDRPWGGGHQAFRWIVTRLVDRGWPVPIEFR